MDNRLIPYREELSAELERILDYWMLHATDSANGGFYGRIDNDNTVHPGAPRGAVLNARVLWTFSAAYRLLGRPAYLATAGRAFRYFTGYFIDREFGGVYWTVSSKGQPADTKKQVYALAFAIYGLSEYAAAAKDDTALGQAKNLYFLLEQHSRDAAGRGYLDAFTREWRVPADLRLSQKDANAAKTMNTHLHIVEAYANLYRVWPDRVLAERIAELLELGDVYFIDPATHHLRLFFDAQWRELPAVISYGHDIEAAWLLQHCAETIGHTRWVEQMKQYAVSLAHAASEGLDIDGGLWYEYDLAIGRLVKEKHWWPQAEAMLGFFNAWQVSGDMTWLNKALGNWDFIKKWIVDRQHGEWFWGITGDYRVMEGEDKVGLWKCPYHNSRACLELVQRIDRMGTHH